MSKKNFKTNRRTRKNEEYFDDVEVIYLTMDEAELSRRLSRVMRTLLEIDEILVSREIGLLGSKEPETEVA